MWYFRAVAVDLDGTLTRGDRLDEEALAAIEAARARRLMMLVTGRILADLEVAGMLGQRQAALLTDRAGWPRRKAPAGGLDPAGATADPPARDAEITVLAGAVELAGRLTVPQRATGLVVFAHGSGSSRHSTRNRHVAGVLNRAGLATLLFDLLTTGEEPRRSRVFDVELLAGRLAEVTRQVRGHYDRVGYFGASTGSAAALWAAAEPGADIAAIVSRGGRPDLAGTRLSAVRAPTLLLVGGDDPLVLDLNRQARAELTCPSELVVIPGATHLFEEPGTLEAVAERARDWFLSQVNVGK
jgi:putative phosphoribosyl transferase